MIVVTTEEVTGHRIVEMKGQVFGLVVRSRGLGGNIVATLRGSHLLRLRISDGRIAGQERLLSGVFGRLRDVVNGPDGLLYFCTSNRDGRGSPVSEDDRILRIVPAS